MTKVLLIGATGMAGQEIYQAATKAGLAVTAQVRHADKARELFGTGVTVLEQDALTLSGTNSPTSTWSSTPFQLAPPKPTTTKAS